MLERGPGGETLSKETAFLKEIRPRTLAQCKSPVCNRSNEKAEVKERIIDKIQTAAVGDPSLDSSA